MGYRSDLTVLIYPDAGSPKEMEEKYAQLKMLMNTTFKDTIDGTSAVDGFATCMHWLDSECVLKFELEGVKWYPSYPDVQLFNLMLGMFDGTSEEGIAGYCTELVRIGEDSDDTEELHTGDNNQYYLHVRRSIDCNV